MNYSQSELEIFKLKSSLQRANNALYLISKETDIEKMQEEARSAIGYIKKETGIDKNKALFKDEVMYAKNYTGQGMGYA